MQKEKQSFVITLSAATQEQLRLYVTRMCAFLKNGEEQLPLGHIAYTLHVGRVPMRERLAVVTASVGDLYVQLIAFLQNEPASPNLFSGEANNQQKVVYNGNLQEMAQLWVQGATIDWSPTFPPEPRRVPLPPYPFAGGSYWIQRPDPSPAQKTGEASQTLPVPERASQIVSDTVQPAISRNDVVETPSQLVSVADPLLLEHVTRYVRTLFAQITEIPSPSIDVHAALEQYGITSQMMVEMTVRLEKDLGKLSKTLFFEYQTLAALAAHLSLVHQEKLATLLGVTPGAVIRQAVQIDTSLAPVKQHMAGVHTMEPVSEDIAIVGLSGRYPHANTVTELWQNLVQGRDCIEEIPRERWDYRPYYQPSKEAEGSIYCKWGGFIDDVDKCDPRFFNISPREIELTDPQERLFLEVAWETLEDAGYTRAALRRLYDGRVGVFVGVMYAEYQLYGIEETMKGHALALGSTLGSIANRISHFFNLHGPSMAIDTMCSSTLTGLHLAVQSIKRGECEAALVGGVNLSLHPNKYIMHSQMKMLASDGRCRSFGAGGDGFVPGEGIGAVFLKPLTKALQDGDHIYGLIKGTAMNNDGKTNGYLVPNPVAQNALISGALNTSGVHPRTISYIEAHGTGTSLGDPIEISGLTSAFEKQTRDRQYCAIGSIKSNIGHCEAAAGIAGLTKVLLQMKYQQLVPSLHAETLNPNIDFAATPFYVQRELSEWKQPSIHIDGKTQVFPRRAGISSFGAGGVNVHVVLEEFVSTKPAQVSLEEMPARQEPQLILLSAKNEERLRIYAQKVVAFLESEQPEQAPQELQEYTTPITIDSILDELTSLISKLLTIEKGQIDVEDEVLEYGFDGMGVAAFAQQVNERYQVTLTPPMLTAQPSLRAIAEDLQHLLACDKPSISHQPDLGRLADLAYTLQVGREAMEERLAIICTSYTELVQRLRAFLAGQVDGESVFWLNIRQGRSRVELFAFDDEDTQDIVVRWLKKGKLARLAQLWVNGGDADWQLLPETGPRRRISLPTYPFAHERYWVPAATRVKTPFAFSPQQSIQLVPEMIEIAPVNIKSEHELHVAVLSLVRQCFAQLVKLDKHQIEPDVSFTEYGIDSIMLAEFVKTINTTFAVKISLPILLELQDPTLLRVTDLLCSSQYNEQVRRVCQFPIGMTTTYTEQVAGAETARRAANITTLTLSTSSEPIAIIGMSGLFPQADDLDQFWTQLITGACAITDVSAERLELAQDAEAAPRYKGGFLNDIAFFDAAFFGISPREAALMDPQQRLFLQTVWKTIEDAGYRPSDLAGSETAVFVGANSFDYARLLTRFGIDAEAHASLGTSLSILANRTSYFFDLQGPSEVIDAACASSTVALHRAVQALRHGEAHLAIAGGVNVLLVREIFESYQQAGMLSASGTIKTFDKDADGYLRGEGIGAILLKPLSQAQADNDHIYAVIRGSAVKHGGKGYSMTTPNATAQAAVILQACVQAGISPQALSYIEAQGAGTVLGDSIEMSAYGKAMAARIEAQEDQEHAVSSCSVGSLKPNIGHLEAASGIAAVIKVVLAMQRKQLPATINLKEVSPEIILEGTPFELIVEASPWEVASSSATNAVIRRAGVHSFGIGGTNAHVILEEYPVEPPLLETMLEPQIYIFSARTPDSLHRAIAQMSEWLPLHAQVCLADIAYTLQVGREQFNTRIALVASSREELIERCQAYLHKSEGDRIEGLYEGTLHHNDPEIKDFVQGEMSQQLMQIALDKRDHKQIALLWVKGVACDWSQLQPPRAHRIALPAYAFEQKRHWFTQYYTTPTTKRVAQQPSERASQADHDVQVVGENTLPQLQVYVKRIVARVLGNNADDIDITRPIGEYGLDSVLATQMKFMLETELRCSLSMSAFGRKQTVEELAALLLEQGGQLPTHEGGPHGNHSNGNGGNGHFDDVSEDDLNKLFTLLNAKQ